jgi:predicted PurR-regulated permease PerM
MGYFPDNQMIWFEVIVGAEIVIYSGFLVFVFYMVYKFLIKLGFYREWNLTTFYIIAILIIVLRIIYFIFAIVTNTGSTVLGPTGWDIYNGVDVTNTYLKVVLGLVQVQKFTLITTDVKELDMEKEN